MTPKALRIAFPRKSRLVTFLSLAISLSLLTPLVPATFSAGSAGAPPVGSPRATTRAAALAVAPIITATKSDAFPSHPSGKAEAGDTITYTVQINNSGTDATGVVFNDTVDANTTLVPGFTTTPVAIDDSYSAVGNVQINPPAGSLTANDSDPDGGTVTAVPATTTSTQGGNVAVNADGSFTYNPPFDSISALVSGAADEPNDNIFLYSGNYTGGLTLLSGQALVGEGSTASLATVTGISPPSYSAALPATGGANPVIGGATGITVATSNLIRGVTIANTGGTGISGNSFGTLAVADTTINATSQALDLDTGQLNAAFQSISSDGSASAAVSLANIAVGSTFSGGATTVNNRGTTGIELDAVQGSIAFGATTVANQMGAGGYGVSVRDSGAAVSFASATISDTNQTVAQVDTTPNDGFP